MYKHEYLFRNTVQCWYNGVDFIQNPDKHATLLARKGKIWGDFCGFKLSVIFCFSHRSDICNINIRPRYNRTRLYYVEYFAPAMEAS